VERAAQQEEAAAAGVRTRGGATGCVFPGGCVPAQTVHDTQVMHAHKQPQQEQHTRLRLRQPASTWRPRGGWEHARASALTMNTSFTKKPMKPISTKPMAVLEQILLNSVVGGGGASAAGSRNSTAAGAADSQLALPAACGPPGRAAAVPRVPRGQIRALG
jgi:hypothetical protein